MTDYPIIFSAPMVRALLDGRKAMTRRLAWQWTNVPALGVGFQRPENVRATTPLMGSNSRPSPWQKVKPGDRLWVRENFRYTNWDDDCQFCVGYEADGAKSGWLDAGDDAEDLCERICNKLDRKGVPIIDGLYETVEPLGITPCIHMPRWASRLTLVVTGTKIERLQDISEEDAISEGIAEIGTSDPCKWRDPLGRDIRYSSPTGAFEELWKHMHGPESWIANPEVVALRFTVQQQNIDAAKVAA